MHGLRLDLQGCSVIYLILAAGLAVWIGVDVAIVALLSRRHHIQLEVVHIADLDLAEAA